MRKNIPASLVFTTLLAASLLITSCGRPASQDPPGPDPKPIDTETEAPQDITAAFWDNCAAMEDTPAVFRLLNKDLSCKPYDHSDVLGNKIILVQQTFISESGTEKKHQQPVIVPGAAGTPAPTLPPEHPMEGTIEPQSSADDIQSGDPADDWNPEWDDYFRTEYQFDLYDPWTDALVTSLDVSDLDLDFYQVLDQKYLILGSYSDDRLYIYDQKLQLISQIENPDFFENCTQEFSPSGEDGYYYCRCYESNTLWKVHLEDFKYEVIDAPLGGIQFLPDSKVSGGVSGSLVTGLNPVSLQKQIAVLDGDGKLQYAEEIKETPWVSGAADNGHIIYQMRSNYGSWRIHSLSGSDSYFALDGVIQLLAIDDSHLLIQAVTYPEDYASGVMKLLLYEIGAGVVSSIQLDMGEEEYYTKGLTYLPDINAVFLPHILADGNTELLAWKLDGAANQLKASINTYASLEEAHQAVIAGTANSIDPAKSAEEISGGFLFTQIEDPDSYDWGALSEAYEQSCELEEQYGVNIYIGAEMPPRVDIYNCDIQTDNSQTEWALDELARYMGFYPDNFFRQLRYGDITEVDIYISGHQYGDGDRSYVNEPGAFVTNIEDHLMMVLNSEYIESWDYTFHHELSHMIDRRLEYLSFYRDGVYSEEKWASHNPDDFSYLNGYADYQLSEGYEEFPEFFCDEYGTTLPTEDRAEVFGNAMMYYITGFDWSDYFREGSPIKDKLAYYAECIRDGFDTTGWPTTTPWEEIANK